MSNYCKECFKKQEEIEQLQAENEQLKADIESRTMCITCERELQNCNLKAENEKLKQENKELAHYLACMTEQRNKSNTCLQEIRELARGLINGSIGGCEDDIGYMLEDILTKAEEE